MEAEEKSPHPQYILQRDDREHPEHLSHHLVSELHSFWLQDLQQIVRTAEKITLVSLPTTVTTYNNHWICIVEDPFRMNSSPSCHLAQGPRASVPQPTHNFFLEAVTSLTPFCPPTFTWASQTPNLVGLNTAAHLHFSLYSVVYNTSLH